VDEAAKLLLDKMQQEFGDEEGNIDVLKAASTIYDNPTLYDKGQELHYQIKAINDMIHYAWACPHHCQVWAWAGLKLTKVFEIVD
jgi:hypothetical protein